MSEARLRPMSPQFIADGSIDDQGVHTLVLAATRKGKSGMLQAEADRLSISYEEIERRRQSTPEQREKARMKQDERDRREAVRLDAVRRAYWDNTDKSSFDLSVLSDALNVAGVAADPTIQQQ